MLSDEPDRSREDSVAEELPGQEPQESPEPTEPAPEPPLEARERWLAAVAYLGPGFLIPIFSGRPRGAFVRWHTQQGFVLFFLEAVLLALVVIFDQRSSLGLVRLRVKKGGEELTRIFHSLEQRAQSGETAAEASPFSEITDEDIDNLFSE